MAGNDAPETPAKRKMSTIVTICTAAGVAIGILVIQLADISLGEGALGVALTGGVAGAAGAGLGALVGTAIERMMKRRTS